MQLRAAGTNLKEGGWCCAVFWADDGPKKSFSWPSSSSSSKRWRVEVMCNAYRLEGSRFGTSAATLATFAPSLVRPKRMKTGGSRERLIGSQLYGPGINESKSHGRMHCVGQFPGAARYNILWPDEVRERISRGRWIRAKAAPLHAMGVYTSRQLATHSTTSARTIRQFA